MTTTANPAIEGSRRSGRRVRVLSWWHVLRSALDRPLTSYYLLLGASALLLTMGLIMVLSASSVYSYQVNDGDSYAVVRRQLIWVLLGQGVLGYTQYFLDEPELLVGMHLFGATLVWIATLRLLLATRERGTGTDHAPAAPAREPAPLAAQRLAGAG